MTVLVANFTTVQKQDGGQHGFGHAHVWAEINFDGISVNIEINQILLASFVVGVFLDLW